MNDKVIVRYPPSPTGEIHIGNIRTLLFNYLFARHNDGKTVLRFEDTDRERSDRKFEQYVIDALDTLGIVYDSGPFRQSERNEFYSDAIQTLLDEDRAYEAEESQDGSGEKVIRFRNPNTKISFDDKIRGTITIDTTDFGDFVIARSKSNPLYHLTVVVDDIDMGVTHVIRGEDHITSTPRQILLIEALGGIVPTYAHIPLIIGEDKKKLSKRHGAVTVGGFIKQGYLPAAIVNYLAFLGWNPGDEREIFSMEELIAEFSLEKVGKSPATFNYQKLDDINHHYMQLLPLQAYREILLPYVSENLAKDLDGTKGDKIIDLVLRERLRKFSEVVDLEQQHEFDYYFNAPDQDESLVCFKDQTIEETRSMIAQLIDKLSEIDDTNWQRDSIKNHIWDWTAEVGRGQVLHPMRTGLSGRAQSPDPFTIAEILGKTETITRLQKI